MNRKLATLIGVLVGLSALAPAISAEDIGVSISLGQPGFYGRLDLSNAPRPRVYYVRPVVIERTFEARAPVYLHVRPGEARHWKKHCRKYNACSERVYFVNHNWYNTVYVPHYRDTYNYREVDGRGRYDHDGQYNERRRSDDGEQRNDHDRRDNHNGRNGGGPDEQGIWKYRD